MVSAIQAVLFDRDKWTVKNARLWLANEGIRPMKAPHYTEHEIRFRIKDPKKFKRFRTKTEPHGIDLVIGFY
jgi:hypothetical protein